MTDSDMVMLIEGLSSDSTSEINGRARALLQIVGGDKLIIPFC